MGLDNDDSRDKGPLDCMGWAVLVCGSAVVSYLRGSLSFSPVLMHRLGAA